MTKTLVLTDDFFNTITLITKSDLYLPNHFYQQILSKIENLKTFPRMYPKIQTKQYRKIPIQKYVILYKIENDTIYIGSIISTKSKNYNRLYQLHKLNFILK